MTRILTLSALAAVTTLSACGADGPPVRPTGSVGVGFGSGGATTDATFGATNGIASGAVSIGIGL